jgi:UDPglucose 6-dehydrogenase
MTTIGVIGTGYVGLVQSVGMCTLGHGVVGIDTNPKKIVSLQQGVLPIHENGLQQLLKTYSALEQLTFSTEYSKLSDINTVFVCVPTPQLESGEADLTYIWQVVDALALLPRIARILVLKSTVPVGTNAAIQNKLDILGLPFVCVSNPEFLRQGSAYSDFLNPERIVIGSEDKDATKKVRELYSYFEKKTVFLETTWESAELIKYAANSFLATKISFINEIAELTEKIGGDVEIVAKGIGLDSRIGPKFLNAGIGYGGSCFPKDVDALLVSGKQQQVHLTILDAAQKVNQRSKDRFVNKINNYYEQTNKSKVISVLGLAFKNDTDDIRSSAALEVVINLLSLGFVIHAFDPYAMESVRKLGLDNLHLYTTIDEVVVISDTLAIVTEWEEFATDSALALYERYSKVIFDGKNLLSRTSITNCVVIGVGKHIIAKNQDNTSITVDKQQQKQDINASEYTKKKRF